MAITYLSPNMINQPLTFTTASGQEILTSTLSADISVDTATLTTSAINFPLDGGDIFNNIRHYGDLTVTGSFSALSSVYITTATTQTSALSVSNTGDGPALFVDQRTDTTEGIAVFKDSAGNEVVTINNSLPNVGAADVLFTGSGNVNPVIQVNTTFKVYAKSVAEGAGTVASGDYSHAEGIVTVASGPYSHAEGYGTLASGYYSHSQGRETTASGWASHTEGYLVSATNLYTHAEGISSLASGWASHAEGNGTVASGDSSHTEGKQTTASGTHSHAEGKETTASGNYSHVEGLSSIASGEYSHAEGKQTTASGIYSHAEGKETTASGIYSHAQGRGSLASGLYSHAEGNYNIASGTYSHAEGGITTASGANGSHAEGANTTASGAYGSHAEGLQTLASGHASHAEGNATIASGLYSHAQGNITRALAPYSHAEGWSTVASGSATHAGGFRAQAGHDYSYVWSGDSTLTSNISSTRTGQYMVSAPGGVFFPGNVGFGTDALNNNALTISGTLSGDGSGLAISGDVNVSNGNIRMTGPSQSVISQIFSNSASSPGFELSNTFGGLTLDFGESAEIRWSNSTDANGAHDVKLTRDSGHLKVDALSGVILTNLPTASAVSLPQGALWIDSGTLKVAGY